MIRLKNLLTETAAPDFANGFKNLIYDVHRWKIDNDKDKNDIVPYLTLIDKAKLSLAKHYVSMWKNKIPKEMPIYPDYADDEPIFTQQVHIISATKNWIRKVVTDVAPSLPYGDKWKLKAAWPFVEWEQIDPITSDILYGIENSIVASDASELEKEWIQWGVFYLIKDRDFAEEMFDIIVD